MVSYSVIIVTGILTNLAILAPFLNNKVILTVTNDNTAKHFRSKLGMIMIIILMIITVINDHPQAMRTPRNIFVINLAISDLLLCSFTIPFTLADSLTAFWELGPEMVIMIVLLMTMVLIPWC